jgi:arylsulfatase A
VVSAGQRHEGVIVEAGGKSPKPTRKAKKGKSALIEGPVTRTSYGDVPGGKDLMNRSGTHVPLIVSWPKQAAHFARDGHAVDDLVDFSDFYATIAELGKSPVSHAIDGKSFAPRLLGKGVNNREFVFCHYWHFGRDAKRAQDSIHDGTYKLYNDGRFYHMAKDINESHALADNELNEVALSAKARLANAYSALRPNGK